MSNKNFSSCPIKNCKSQLASPKQIMCSGHFDRVSVDTRAQIQTLKKDRASTSYLEAVKTAVVEVEADEKREREVDAYIGRY